MLGIRAGRERSEAMGGVGDLVKGEEVVSAADFVRGALWILCQRRRGVAAEHLLHYLNEISR